MEFQRLKARLAMIDSLLDTLDPNTDRVQYLRRTVYVLRNVLQNRVDLPAAYGPPTPIARFSLQ